MLRALTGGKVQKNQGETKKVRANALTQIDQ